MSDVTFTSWGSANSIGPSCHVLQFGDFRVGIDYGAGIREGEQEPAHDRPLDAIIATHAHRDHIGMLPRALTRWPKAQSWATFETMALARWIWDDELNIARREEREYPFQPDDIERVSRRTKRLIAGTTVFLKDDLAVTPFTAGHILGAVGLTFRYKGELYIATGDIGLRSHGFIAGADITEYPRTRLLIRESTYVGQHPTDLRCEIESHFISRIEKVLEGGGRVLIPTLSIDRMPEIYALLHASGIHRKWPLWVIGGARPAEIYLDYARDARVLGNMRRFENRQHQDDTRKSGLPMVVLASSGMVARDTPSYTWATDILSDEGSAIFMVNWQDPCTPGGIILNGTDGEELQLPTGRYRRRCAVQRFDFSSHAKEDEMQEIERRFRPDEVIHVHGEGARIDAFIGSTYGRGPVRRGAKVGESLAL